MDALLWRIRSSGFNYRGTLNETLELLIVDVLEAHKTLIFINGRKMATSAAAGVGRRGGRGSAAFRALNWGFGGSRNGGVCAWCEARNMADKGEDF